MARRPSGGDRPSEGTGGLAARLWLVPALTVALAAVLPFLPTLSNGLVWDDILHIAANPRVRAWPGTLGYFAHAEALYHRPLIFFGYAAEYAAWGAWPAGFHLTNLVLHVAATLLVFALGWQLGLSRTATWLAAALFATHPVQVDAVAYVSGRTDLLVAVGALTVWLAAWSDGRRVLRMLFALLGTALAVWSKESGYAILPFLLWAGARRRKPLAVVGPAFAFGSIALALRPGLTTLAAERASAMPSAAALGRALGTYAGLFFWPVDLRVDRLTLVPVSGSETLAGTAMLIAALAVFLWGATRRGPAADCTVWAAAFYLPASNLIIIYPVVAAWALFTPEHNLYVPLAGLALLAGLAADALVRRGDRTRRAVAVLAGVLVVILGAASARRTLDWKDEERLFASAVAAGSRSPRVHFNLGNVLLARNDLSGAVAAYEGALAFEPRDAAAWGNLAVARQRQGDLTAALEAYRKALERRPGDARLHENLGSLYLARGDANAARAAFAEALRLDPQRTMARRALETLAGRGAAP